jgi:hypothetical protein
MKRWMSAALVVCSVGFVVLERGLHAQNPGPGQFSNPFDPTPVARPGQPAPASSAASFTPPFNPAKPASDHEDSSVGNKILSQYGKLFPLLASKAGNGDAGPRPLQASFESLQANRDIEIHEHVASWCIYIHSYKGADAPKMARDFVTELRSVHKLPAYVFNYGEAEMRREYERVKSLIDHQKQMLKQQGLSTDMPIKVRYTPYEPHVGILVGGWNSEDEARRALAGIHKLPMPDPTRIKLDQYWQSVKENQFANTQTDKKTLVGFRVGDKAGVLPDHSFTYVNPFPKAWVCRNPALPHQQTNTNQELDAKFLRNLNSNEPYSLLNCPKPFTLVIKEFSTPRFVRAKEDEKSVMETLGFGAQERLDAAAVNAHNLADVLRRSKQKLEAYVLHTQYNSFVTIGSFDAPDDPNLKAMQDTLQKELNIPAVGLLPRPLPFKVPR